MCATTLPRRSNTKPALPHMRPQVSGRVRNSHSSSPGCIWARRLVAKYAVSASAGVTWRLSKSVGMVRFFILSPVLVRAHDASGVRQTVSHGWWLHHQQCHGDIVLCSCLAVGCVQRIQSFLGRGSLLPDRLHTRIAQRAMQPTTAFCIRRSHKLSLCFNNSISFINSLIIE